MKLLTKQLKTFNSIAGGMKQNNVLPILSYLKFDDGYITKNNLESFVTMEADFKGKCLIDEKILMSVVNSTSEDVIEISVKDKSVIISYGAKKTVSPTDDMINFPANDEAKCKEIELSPEIIKAVKIASNFTVERENVPFTSCVFIGNGIVAASTGFVAYAEKASKKLPEIVVERNAAAAIKNFESVSYSENDSYRFYTNHIFKFGFIKTDVKFYDMRPFSVLPKDVEEKNSINKKELLEFCDICVSSSGGRPISANLKGKMLTMVDADYGINHEHPISVELPEFNFNPSIMSKMLKSLPNEEIILIRSKDRYYVTGESGYVALIMEMQPS